MLKRVRLAPGAGSGEEPMYRLELDLDFSRIPVDANVDVIVDGLIQDEPGAGRRRARPVPHATYGDTKMATMWILLPERRHAGRLELIAYSRLRPQDKRSVRPTREFEARGGSVLGWQIIGPDPTQRTRDTESWIERQGSPQTGYFAVPDATGLPGTPG